MDEEPQGVPRECLPLDKDAEFKRLEGERNMLKTHHVEPTDPRLLEVEEAMNARANEMAKAMRDQAREQVLPEVFNGIPREALHLDEDMPYTGLEAAHIMAGDDEGRRRDLADAMAKRAADVASKLRVEERGNLGEPLGYAPEDLPLDQNREYLNKETELIVLRADPEENAKRIAEVEEELRVLAVEIAKEKAEEEREYLDTDLEGCRPEELNLLNDPQYAELEEEYHRARKDPNVDEYRMNELEKLMNARAHELARLKNAEERSNFLEEQRGVPLSELPLDTDDEFRQLEAERARLLREPLKNTQAILAIEKDMNERIAELTAEAVKNDRIFLDEEPEGVPQRQLDLDNDPEFQGLEKQRAALKAKDARKNAAAIHELEAQMNDRLHNLAEEKKWDARKDMGEDTLGIPLKDLADKFDNDKHFHDLEEQYRDARSDPSRQKLVEGLLEQMKERAKELADEMHEEERGNLEQDPEGVPLAALGLNTDEKFLTLENEARKLRNEPNGARRNAERLMDLEEQMNDRTKELATEARKTYIDTNPERVPLELLKLGEDPAFVAKEHELRRLAKNPVSNKERIRNLKDELNELAQEKAKSLLENDRGYLDPEPEGVELRHVAIDQDPQFREMEVERARLKAEDPRKNQRAIASLESKLNERAHELAKALKDDETNAISDATRGVPITVLNPHEDAEFKVLAAQYRDLKLNPQKGNAAVLRDVKQQMKERAAVLADQKVQGDRGFLNANPEGVAVRDLPLDKDPKFHDLEVQRAKLKASGGNPAKIKELEEQLNAQAEELARALKKKDLEGLNQKPEGIPIDLLDPHGDAEFAAYLPQLRELKKDPKANKAAIDILQQDMNDRVKQLADDKLRADRPKYVEDVVDGVPRDILPLDKDPKFHELEVQRAVLRTKDPRRNADKIKDLEAELNERAGELAAEQKKKDLECLDQNPEGIPLSILNPHADSEFAQLVEARRELMKDPKKNAEALQDLEVQMNDCVTNLAKAMRENERAFLDPEPESIPIEDVPVDKDQNFLRMEDYLRKLKKDPRRNAQMIKDTQDKMNDRAHELAKEIMASDVQCLPNDKYRGIPREDLNLHASPEFREAANRRRKALSAPKPALDEVARMEEEMDDIAREIANAIIENDRAFLDTTPEGIDRKDLLLDEDRVYLGMEAELRKLQKTPAAAKRNKEAIRDLQDQMNDRVHELAKSVFAKQREEFLDAEPEGIPLSRLPLDVDPAFKEAEIARYNELKKDSPDANTLKELEERMNDRAHALATEMLSKDRAFLDPEPDGVPLDLLPLATDAAFNELMHRRQALKNAGKKSNDPAIKEIEGKINDRAHTLARDFLMKNRGFLDPDHENVPIEDIPLNSDPVFREMETELMQLKKDPVKNKSKISELEEDMNERAGELARNLLKKERAAQDQEPFGVPLDLLPLNEDADLNELERRRRALKKDPRGNAEALRAVEAEIEERVRAIAEDYLDTERKSMDQEPEGVPLRDLNLSNDTKFHEIERELRDLMKNPSKNKEAIADLQEQMNDRAHVLAKKMQSKDRGYLNPEQLGVPIDLLPLNSDPEFVEMERNRRELKKNFQLNGKAVRELEDQLNDRAKEIAREYLNEERAFLDQNPKGIALKDLPLEGDKKFHDLEKQLRQLKKDPRKNADAIAEVQEKMNERAHELAKRKLAGDRSYLYSEAHGVPLADLDLDNDAEFLDLERQRKEALRDPKRAAEVADLEELLNERVDQIAAEYLKKDRAYLDPEPEGVPLDELPLSEDLTFKGMENERRHLKIDESKNKLAIQELESKLNDRAHALAREKKGFQDPDFHAANEDIAELWPRLRDLYPEGVFNPITPDTTLPSDVSSAGQDMGFLAPFIAALSRHTVLISRLFLDKAHPYMHPYRIQLFNPDCSPATVEVDDRVPCDESKEPKFTQVPSRMWYPLLLEKAYAKFVGGYENFNNCNAHDTLRDLTGRPVVHISLEDPKHAAAQNMGNFTTPAFWHRVNNNFSRGDVFICVSNGEVPDGIHPQCCYALMDVIELHPESEEPEDVVIKVHNCYGDEPLYSGPLRKGDPAWTSEMRRACGYKEDETDVLYMPLPTFLDNFSCMQRCKINCGDRLSAPGEWNEYTAGGTSKFTTFRSNPIYVVQNKTARPATILAEVRHAAPLYVDETNCKRYPYTGLTVMQPIDAKLPPTPFITNGTHKFIQKGMMLDSREVCSEVEIPASTTCYLIPYTKDRGTFGNFTLSIYPDAAKLSLTPLGHAGLTLKPLKDTVKIEGNSEGARLDFMVSEPCDVHVLLHQNQVSDANSVRRGDAVGEDEVALAAFNEYGIRVGSTGDPSAAREHALVFKAPQGGRYSLLATCSTSGPCPATIEIYTAPKVEAELVPVAPDAKPLCLQSNLRFPALNRTATAPMSARGVSRERTVSRERGSSRGGSRRTGSLPAPKGAVSARGGSGL
ncbi:calpain-like cysteine peptidase [Strigomonas culicis]|uniref:Calpain-like cysteine peptidase n=1 Tax=Strigomonas culicis TaxID=28005 RepID=S9TMG5_9TRYP|nr:calpain-like cysteine peptidase [Strigomonas culicis]|eukprot:EPY19437.1 calpain-like cysteine peptidase [Strigomonas culicis]